VCSGWIATVAEINLTPGGGAFVNLIRALPRIWCRSGPGVGPDWNLQERSKARASRSRRGIHLAVVSFEAVGSADSTNFGWRFPESSVALAFHSR
jgi:hypothetical protein